jgi:microcompartment protein CcmL/EutN
MVIESLGIFETASLSSSLVAVNSILKEKGIKIISKQILGEGIVSVFLIGELGALKRGSEFGTEALKYSGDFRGFHIIPFPHSKLLSTFELIRD